MISQLSSLPNLDKDSDHDPHEESDSDYDDDDDDDDGIIGWNVIEIQTRKYKF